jgi:hypothetical protein
MARGWSRLLDQLAGTHRTAVVLKVASAKEGRDRLGNISKQGDRYLRSLFMAGKEHFFIPTIVPSTQIGSETLWVN